MRSHRLCLTALILAVCGFPAMALADDAGTFRVGGALGLATFAPDDINDIIDHHGEQFSDFVDSLESEPYVEVLDFDYDDDELGGGLVLEVQMEYLISDNVGLGLEFLPLSSKGGCDLALEWEDWLYSEWVDLDEHADFEAAGNLVSVYGFYRMPVGNALSLRVGGGLDCVFGGKLEYDDRFRVEREDEWDYWEFGGGSSFEATGSGFGFHALLGGEYQVTDRLVLVGDVAYRAVTIEELEVEDPRMWSDSDDDDDWPDMEEGETLRWSEDDGFSTEGGSEVGLDFGGLYLTVGALFCF